MEQYGIKESDTFRTFTIQEVGGTKKTVAAGVEAIKEMLPTVNAARRETLPASELTLALQCGGSDGYSGITANVALGAAVDKLVEHGGTAVLSETPEIYGAEHLLTRRAATREVGEKLVDIIHWWQDYCAKNNGSMDNNPSPGNKAGGLTTILEKSLGAAAKGGTRTMTAVYRYAEPITAKGFVYMDTPGYDPVAATGQVAGGCNVLCFTTGRGSAYGCKPTPSIKLATNSAIYHQMLDDMDINCGDILDGVSIEAEGPGDLRSRAARRVRRACRNRSSSATATPSSCPGSSARRCERNAMKFEQVSLQSATGAILAHSRADAVGRDQEGPHPRRRRDRAARRRRHRARDGGGARSGRRRRGCRGGAGCAAALQGGAMHVAEPFTGRANLYADRDGDRRDRRGPSAPSQRPRRGPDDRHRRPPSSG